MNQSFPVYYNMVIKNSIQHYGFTFSIGVFYDILIDSASGIWLKTP